MHGSGSLGTNVLCPIVGCLLCCAGIGPHISKIATEIRIALMLRLLQPYYGIAVSVRPLVKQSHKRPRSASAGWPGGKTLTRIPVPHHRLAFTAIADPGSCRDRVGEGGCFSADFLIEPSPPHSHTLRFSEAILASANRQPASFQYLPHH